MIEIKIEDYNVSKLEEEINLLFKEIIEENNNHLLLKVISHIMHNDFYENDLNKFSKENNLPLTDGFINPSTRSVLDNCINLAYQIERFEKLEKFKLPVYAILNLKMLVYLQVLETKYTAMVLGNALLVIKNEKPQGDIFDNAYSCKNYYEKISSLYNEIKDDRQFKCIEKWLCLFDFDLRNAIAHNDYYIDKITKYINIPTAFTKSITGKNKNEKRIDEGYDENYINTLFICAKNFNEAFNNMIDYWYPKVFTRIV
jgi:hypothetical protein